MENTVTIHNKTFEMYISNQKIQHRIDEIVEDLLKEYKHKNPIFIVVLKGAFMFASDILKKYNQPCEIEFAKLSSYVGMESSGKIRMDFLPTLDKLINQDIIIIEDIVDSGNTMHYFINFLKENNTKSIALVSLLYKPENLEKEVTINHIGFTIPNKFVIGYGLDYDGLGRNFRDIYSLQ